MTNNAASRSRSRSRIRSRAALLAGAAGLSLLALAGCSAEAEPVPSDDNAKDIGAIVQVYENKYDPADVTIKAGQAVRWEFVGRDKHDVVSTDRSFVSELVPGGTTYTHIFDKAGEYSYTCSIHPEMLGVVTVE